MDGTITAHNEESAVVSDICTAYLAGKSLLTIVEILNERQIEYMPGVFGWNKARLKRILEDEYMHAYCFNIGGKNGNI